MKKAIVIFIFLLLPVSVLAFEMKADDNVYLGSGKVIEGSYFVAGSSITIDGDVKGDLFCAGQSITINGNVEGDVICAGQSINVQGVVGGNLRVAGNTINIGGKIARNTNTLGANIHLGKDAEVGGEMISLGANTEVLGSVGKDLYGAGASLFVGGDIARDVRFRLDDNVRAENKGINFNQKEPSLVVSETAKIGGNLFYTAKTDADIKDGATISGETKRNEPKLTQKNTNNFNWLTSGIYSIFGALVIGLVLVSIFKKQIKELTEKMKENIPASIGWGASILFLTPIIAILLLITIIGIPLAFILIMLWIIALMIAKVITGILVGREILKKYWKDKKDSYVWALIVGVVVTGILFSLPFIGWAFSLLALFWGLGGVWLYLKKT